MESDHAVVWSECRMEDEEKVKTDEREKLSEKGG